MPIEIPETVKQFLSEKAYGHGDAQSRRQPPSEYGVDGR